VVHVIAPSDCRQFTGGLAEFDVEADTVRRLISELEARFPGLGDYVERRMSIAIDGEIHQDAWFSPIRPNSEIYLIPKIGGG
jgi:molybdopterin converting factor small subunit